MSHKGQKSKAAFLLGGLFLAGVLLGVALDRYVLNEVFLEPESSPVRRWRHRRHRKSKDQAKKLDRLVSRFKRKLGLNAEQEKVVRKALEQSWQETNAVRLKIEPRLRAIRQSHRKKILQVLDPKQRKRYERMVRRYEEKRALRLR